MSRKRNRGAGASASGAAAPERPSSGASRQTTGRFILLATEGRPLSNAVIAHAARLAQQRSATVRILAIARVHGVALGLPNPGLLPTRREWAEREQTVERAIGRLRRKGIAAEGQIVATRKGAQRICQEAREEGCEAIVMGADPPRNRVIAELYWSQEPQRVSRQAKVSVHLLVDGESEVTETAR